MILVSIAFRSGGGVSRLEISRIPSNAMWSVRGIGVAERVRMSTVARSDLSHSLSSTPKRCSSSITIRPRSLNATSFCTSRWVPMRMSTFPSAVSLRTCRISFRGRKRLTTSTRNGNSAIRFEKERWCCSARTVVGTRTATCLPESAALKAARMATSVLP